MTQPSDLPPLAAVSTPDVNRERLEALKRLMPDLFSAEGRVNPEELRRIIEGEGTGTPERYEFRWYGKAASKRFAFAPTTAALEYDAARSVNPDKAGGNVIIEGENLEVLKLFLAAYRDRVKLVVIDPPYNTGKDFIYRDNFTKDRKDYWCEIGATDAGVKLDTNAESSGRYHSDWLTMMYGRLLLARQLLDRDGFILVSIDDAEVCNLGRLLDDAFGEENHVATLVYDKNRKNDAKFVSVGHEYMLMYARDRSWLQENGVILRADKDGVDEVRAEFDKSRKKHGDNWDKVRADLKTLYDSWTDDDPRNPLSRFNKVDADGPYRDDGNINWPGGGGPTYDVLHPRTGRPCKKPISGWRYPKKSTMDTKIRDGLIVFGPDETTVPSIRTNLFDKRTQVMRSVIFSYAQTATQEFTKIFGGKKVFENPKHFSDIAKLIEYLPDAGSIILDFFAGSGTTGHATLVANGKRDFILVQIPESISDKESVGQNAIALGYKTISDITIDRVKRVIMGYADNPAIPEAGFKVYRLRKSTFPRVEYAPDPAKTREENIEALKRYIAEKEATMFPQIERDVILDEVLLKNGFMFDRAIEQAVELTDNAVFRVRDTFKSALVCLDPSIKAGTVAWFQKNKAEPFICLELALDTTAKWNLRNALGSKAR